MQLPTQEASRLETNFLFHKADKSCTSCGRSTFVSGFTYIIFSRLMSFKGWIFHQAWPIFPRKRYKAAGFFVFFGVESSDRYRGYSFFIHVRKPKLCQTGSLPETETQFCFKTFPSHWLALPSVPRFYSTAARSGFPCHQCQKMWRKAVSWPG